MTLQQLSGLDASFIYLETARSPMHIGALSVLEGSLDFDAFREVLRQRMHLVPRLTQRLLEVPLGLDRPYWADDPDFNLDLHLNHIALPAPGGWRQLRRITSRIFSQPLDRSRPLWEMTFVEGLNTIPQVPPRSVAVVSKVHHAAIDGVSGADILGLLFDLSPEGREVAPPPPQGPPEALPSDMELLTRSSVHMATRPLKLPNLLWDAVKSSAAARVVKHIERISPPPPAFSAPRTPINGTISSNRVWNTALLSLDRVKRLKNAVPGTTVNDAMLAICAGALRSYLLRRDALPEEPLVAMVPVSTRPSAQRDATGNQVSMMFIQLATDIADPIERFKKINDNARKGKIYYKATNAQKLMEYGELIPFGLAGQAARAYSRVNLADHHRPIFNVVITNVPGPQVPLYLGGKRLLAHMGTAPIFEGMGLMIPIFSYDGVISISPTSCDNLMPDLDDFARDLRESANTLEAAILAQAPHAEEQPAGGSPDAIARIFAALRDHLAAHPEMELPGGEVYQFDVTGDQAQRWSFDLSSSPPRIHEGASEDAVCTLRMSERHVVDLVQGELDGPAAFMQGKLKVEGDINKAIAFGEVLGAFPGDVARGALA